MRAGGRPGGSPGHRHPHRQQRQRQQRQQRQHRRQQRCWGAAAAAVAATLAAAAAVAGGCPAVCRCAGGRVYCNDRGLTAVPEGLPPGATTLFLQNNRIGDAGIPPRLGRLPALRVLYLYANALEHLPAHLPPALRELHLQDNNVRALGRRALARAPLLERLHLDDNSVSAAGIEEDAFAESPRLRLLFLSRNHLSSVPPGLPPGLEELRLDDNRIATIPLRAFEGLPALRRLVLDGNLLANRRMADDTFARLHNLSELSLGRNALAAPPANLPRARLRRLSLAANAISHVPPGALARMRALERLDLSDNNLTTLPPGVFDDLGSLSQLLLRNNPWFCGCGLAWLPEWLRRRAPPRLQVRGLLCQAPARLRGLPVGELRAELRACSTPPPPPPPVPAAPALWVEAAPGPALRVRWPPAPAGAALRLSWLRPGAGAVTETLVRGERGEYVVTALQPRAAYRVCLAALEPPGAPPRCAHGRTDADADTDTDADTTAAPSPATAVVPPAVAAAAAGLALGVAAGCYRRRRGGRRGGDKGGGVGGVGGVGGGGVTRPGLPLRPLRDGGVRTVFPPAAAVASGGYGGGGGVVGVTRGDGDGGAARGFPDGRVPHADYGGS